MKYQLNDNTIFLTDNRDTLLYSLQYKDNGSFKLGVQHIENMPRELDRLFKHDLFNKASEKLLTMVLFLEVTGNTRDFYNTVKEFTAPDVSTNKIENYLDNKVIFRVDSDAFYPFQDPKNIFSYLVTPSALIVEYEPSKEHEKKQDPIRYIQKVYTPAQFLTKLIRGVDSIN